MSKNIQLLDGWLKFLQMFKDNCKEQKLNILDSIIVVKLTLVVANLGNTKGYKKPEIWLKP